HAEMFMMFASLKLEGGVKMEKLPIVCEFPDVFPEDVSDVPPERSRVYYRFGTWYEPNIYDTVSDVSFRVE
ncbi:cellular nucleic acid-binding protein, partial [Trifolium medium]|nr:cellular nucleic acid-binding protein [Trifolium medium]